MMSLRKHIFTGCRHRMHFFDLFTVLLYWLAPGETESGSAGTQPDKG
jgi:hypothetical protein